MISNKNIQTIRLPSGEKQQSHDDGFYPLLSWADEIKKRDSNDVDDDKMTIMSIAGRPTAPIFPPIIEANRIYWSNIADKADAAIDYGDIGRGQHEYRCRMAEAFTRDYKTSITNENVIFTVGGKSAINAWHHVVNTLRPGKKVCLAMPYYPDHLLDQKNVLLVECLNEKLTAQKMLNTLRDSQSDESDDAIGAFIFCDPSNPMGHKMSESEWRRIISRVLLSPKHSRSLILLDEAYAEMIFDHDTRHVSLLTLANQSLKERIIVLRSATKAMSAAGERYACILAFSRNIVELISHYNDTQLIHAPLSSQHAYTYAMERFTLENRRDISEYYKRIVLNTQRILNETTFNFKERQYAVNATFYVIADFSSLLGRPLDPRVSEQVGLGGGENNKRHMHTDVDIAFHLLFKYKVALCPMSVFGVEAKRGLMRVTCSFSDREFNVFAKRLEIIRREEVDEKEEGVGEMVLSLKRAVKSFMFDVENNNNNNNNNGNKVELIYSM
jgi:aspartate/methionine/tyrosine aminotransferase